MAEAKISSDRWVLDADLEGQKEEQNVKVSRDKSKLNVAPQDPRPLACKESLSRHVSVRLTCLTFDRISSAAFSR